MIFCKEDEARFSSVWFFIFKKREVILLGEGVGRWWEFIIFAKVLF